MPHLTKAIANEWATESYLGGFKAAMDSYESGAGCCLPPTDIDVSIFDPRNNGEISSPKKPSKVSPEKRSQEEYDPCKCDARVWNNGFGAQCNRKKVED